MHRVKRHRPREHELYGNHQGATSCTYYNSCLQDEDNGSVAFVNARDRADDLERSLERNDVRRCSGARCLPQSSDHFR